jgi:hypothetical protein
MIYRSKVGKFLTVATLWIMPACLLFLLLFSVYPNYLLGHQNKYFIKVRNFADNIAKKIIPHKLDYNSFIILNTTKTALNEDSGLPLKFNQPLIVTVPPDEISTKAYFQKPSKPVVYHTTMIPDPFTTYAPLPGKIGGLVFHNRQQFRYTVDLEKKKNNEIRIFITGGSAAWGSTATATEFTIAGFMQSELSKKYPGLDIKVITAAAGAWTSTQERIWIFNRISEYEPDMIISYSGHNDFYDTYLSKEDLFDRYYVEGKYFRNAIVGYEYYNRGKAISLLGLHDTGTRFSSADFPRKTLKNIEIINSYLQKINVPYVYVLQPVRKDFRQRNYPELYARLGLEMASLGQKDGFGFVDHSDFFDMRPELFTDQCHLGDRGNQMIANDLLAKIDITPIINKVKAKK